MSHFWKLLFIPHERNNLKALLIQPLYLGILIALYLLNQSLIKSFTMVRPGVLGYSSEITAEKVVNQTNLTRQKLGLPLLVLNSSLSRSATAKAKDMFASNYWAHTSPSGKSPWEFFKESGYSYTIAGENLAKDFYDTESLMKAWMKSPTHKANIISSKYEEIGVGVVNGTLNGVRTTLVVQHFGTPQAGQAVAAPKRSDTVLSDSDVSASPSRLISPLQISQAIGTIMFVIIIGVLIADAILTLRDKNHRLSSHSFGHVGFLGVILMLLLFTRSGTIF